MTLNSSAFRHLRNSVELLIAEGVFPPAIRLRPHCSC